MNRQFGNNRLINEYTHFNQNNMQLPNNVLLQNNPFLVNNQDQLLHMQKIKEIQQVKHIDKMNELSNTLDKQKIKESVIRPIKIEKNKKDRYELESNWKEAEKKYRDNTGKDYGIEIHNYWKQRTNQPYKTIIKDETNAKKNYKSKDDLIVHRVTHKDKDKEVVEKSYQELEKNLEKHNNELHVIYSTSNKNEHKKKFEYNHVYKYRVQYDPKDHDKLKSDRIKYYKDKQKQEEEGKKTVDSILDTLMNEGIFDKDELSSISLNKKDPENIITIDNNSETSSENKSQSKKEAYLSRRKK